MLSRIMGSFFGNLMPYITMVQAVAFFVFINNLEKSYNKEMKSFYTQFKNNLYKSEFYADASVAVG